MRKKIHSVKLVIEGKTFLIPVDVVKSSYRSWDISKYGVEICSVGGKAAAREDALVVISKLCQQIYDGKWVDACKGRFELRSGWDGAPFYNLKEGMAMPKIELSHAMYATFPQWDTYWSKNILGASWRALSALYMLERWLNEESEGILKSVNTIKECRKFGI